MCKFVLTAAAAALSIACAASAQTARLDVQVSSDNVNWSSSIFAPAGSTAYIRVVASTDMASAVGLASVVYQPTLSNWTAADTRVAFNNATSGAQSANNTGLPANLGRMSPYGQASMTSTSTPGVPTSFIDGTSLRIAGSRATTLTTSADYGIWSTQGSKVSSPSTYNQSNTAVIFKYAVTFGPNPALRAVVADVPVAGIKSSRIGWYTSLTTSSGNVVYTNLTQADVHPATINVGPPNMPPVAQADSFNMLEDQSLVVTNGSVLNNDSDADANDTMTAELVATTAHGSLTFNADGTFAYNPQADYNGADSFTYRVRDSVGAASNIATVTINVADVNDTPVFSAADPATATEDSGERVIPNWANFNPGTGETQSVAGYEVMTLGNVGLFAMGGWPRISPDGTLRYTPAANMSGSSTFEVRVRDSGGTTNGGNDMSDPQMFTIRVLPVNDAPILTTTPVAAVREDSGQRSLANWAAFNPGPGEGDQSLLGYSVSNVSNPALFSLQPTVAPDGTLVYTPAPNAAGSSTFTLTVRDSGGTANGGSDTSAAQVITITVTQVNDAPSFGASNPALVLEDSGAKSIAGWATFNSGGGAFESSQTAAAYLISNVSNPALFAVQPAVSTAGVLTYTPAANAFGTSTFTVQVRDSGGVDDGGLDTSAPQTFTITVDGVNDAPTFAAAATTTSNEDAGAQSLAGWATFNAGPNEAAQSALAYTVSNLTNAALFTSAPSVSADGTLTYATAPNASGSATFQVRVRDSGGVANGGVDTSGVQTFTINVNPVNDAPTVNVAAIPTVLEDATAQSVASFATFNAGPGEAAQTLLGYIVSGVSDPAMFAVQPAVSNAGTLTYTLAPNASGTVQFSVQSRDNGGVANGGVDTSAPVLATLNITAVNDAPTFNAANPAAVDEDAGAQTVFGWAAFNSGPGEFGQAPLAYTVSGISNAALFAVAPAVGLDGTLTYTPAANVSGSATFQVRVRDNGGVANGGADTSAPLTFAVTVNSVNDAPTVSIGSAPTVLEDGGVQTVANFASFNPGPNEATQTLSAYIVGDVSNPALFAAGPSISNAGTLTYTPAPNASGSATFSVIARDSGGTANGGDDTSAPIFGTINVTGVNDAPTFTASSPAGVNEDAGAQSIPGWSAFNAGPGETAQTVLAYTVSAVSNPSLFAAVPAIAPDGTLTFTPAANVSGASTFQVRVRDSGGVANGGSDTSGLQTFSITVNSVNDAPTVTLGAIPTIVEDGGSQTVPNFAAFNAGPNESSQSLSGYIVSDVSNPAMFSAGPSVSLSGTLTYTPAPNASGSVSFSVSARDNGGTLNGGIDTSAPVLGTINITNVNDAPTFAAANPAATIEDAGPVTLTGWSSFNPGPFESGQTAEYQVTAVSNPGLFAVPPAISPAGALSYTAAANASGSSTFTVRVRDNGGTASGGQDTSGSQTFTLNVTAVNDAPVVTVNSIPVIEEDSPAQIVPGFAQFDAGPGESGQSLLAYTVSDISNPAAFVVPPSVSPSGVLTYTPAPDASGTITFKVRVRDNGGVENGGVDTSGPATGTLTINGVNDPPVAIARNVTIDARTGCPSLVVTPEMVNNGSYDPDNGPAELTFRISRTGEFPVGVTPVTLTVTDAAGLVATSQASVTVQATDSNQNQVPDTCDAIRGGTGPDCDNNGDTSESGCVWDNGGAVASQSPPEGQLSQYGGSIAARVADDFYLEPGLLYRITSFRGQILTNSIERTARVQFFKDCNGAPALEPFASFESSSVAGETDGGQGKMLVTYVFDFCEDKLVLEGGAAYWVSLQGKVNCNITDQAFWASVGVVADPRRQVAMTPYKALGISDHPCTVTGYEDWETIADCCIGCAKMAFLMTGHACQLIWDNGAVDLGATRGGDPSGINRGIFSRAADNIVVKPCRSEKICWIEAYIWTNCTPVQGFLELYGDTCTYPTPPSVAPLRRITPTDIIEIDEHITVDGREYRLVKLEFWNVPWMLDGGKNYWISVGADGAGSFNARSFFAWSEPMSPCGCREVHFNKGAKLANRQSDIRWTRSDREYAFRIATKPFWTDPVQTNIPPSRACPVDMNDDYMVSIQDLFTFLQEWFSGCP